MPLDLPLVLHRPWFLDTIASTTSRFTNMIVKSESSPARTKSFHLTCLDQNVVRVYIQTLCIFPFPNQNHAEAAIHALGTGLRLTLKKFPFLAGTLRLADRKTGKLALDYPIEVSDDDMNRMFRSKQIPFNETTFPHSYEQLKRDGMPPSAFKGDIFVPEDLANYVGVPRNGEGKIDFDKSDAPAMRVQAFFIPGGLVLSMYTNHSVSDFSGITAFWQNFSANVAMVSGGCLVVEHDTMSTSFVADEESLLRQAVDGQVKFPPNDGGADCYCDGTFEYPRTLPSETKCTQRLFVIPAARVHEYRELLRPRFPQETPPTICNVLAALVWTHVTRARADRLLKRGLTVTKAGIATDLRRRQHPPVPADYMGNMALFSQGTLNVSDLTAEDCVTMNTIVHVINEIKSTITDVNNDWISRHMTFFTLIERITDTEIALALTFGPDMYISSWLNFGADLNWGIPGTDVGRDTLAGRPEFIRRTYGPGDGGIIFLPRRRQTVSDAEAPFEILVRLSEEDMTRLLNEQGGLKDWADAVID
ncbi:hypothetical protein BDW02DRAFT_620534 [Decorospora gaudefroyi]|uniref:Trichothecene 3-O-acetyltransferas-like protein n=1 Tax=Decorospora gaudefroyi TaxID=184978 RepID=A0A6A5KAM8_9PLEO|nr:hypothetical protein BDW02DRAFT_620534 [Decorospora gaudefroyi]